MIEITITISEEIVARGPKIKSKFQIYSMGLYLDTVVGFGNVIKYVKKNFDLDIKKCQVVTLCKCYRSKNEKIKLKNYLKYEGLEINKIK